MPNHRKPHTLPAHVTNFVVAHVGDARQVSAKTGVPVEVILAQSAIESSWGRTVKDNAYFGVKGRTPSGQSTSFATHEYTAHGKVLTQGTFRAYTGYADAAQDYASVISRRYAGALVYKHDPVRFAQEVARQGYATDPDYGKKLESIIKHDIIPALGAKP